MAESIPVDLQHVPQELAVEQLANHTSIRKALDWLLTQTPAYRPLPPIAQDEYCHDVVFEHPAGHWIVYDST